MFQRRISADDVRQVLSFGEVIEEYTDDQPFPSRLYLALVAGRPLHVVVAGEDLSDTCIIVTAYEPDLERWEPGFRRRRK